jgi:hypothetical protein
MDVEAGVAPGENAFRPFRAQEFLPDEKRQDLAAEDCDEPRVVDPRDLIGGADEN